MDRGNLPGKTVILRKRSPPGPIPEVDQDKGSPSLRSPETRPDPSSPGPAPQAPPKKAPGPQGAKPQKVKRQPPQVIFWHEDNTLWTWATVPPHPRLLELFGSILEECKKREWASVTVLRYFHVSEKNPAYSHGQKPCLALDFAIGGVRDVKARNFAQKVSSRWIHGGEPGPKGKPRQVLRYMVGTRQAHFHLEVTEETRPVEGS